MARLCQTRCSGVKCAAVIQRSYRSRPDSTLTMSAADARGKGYIHGPTRTSIATPLHIMTLNHGCLSIIHMRMSFYSNEEAHLVLLLKLACGLNTPNHPTPAPESHCGRALPEAG